MIVTESDEHWVRGTAELLLPGSAAACLQNVEVVSSRGRFGTDFPCQPACWQIAAFSYVTNRYLLSPAAAAEVGIGPRSSGAEVADTADVVPTDLAAKDVASKNVPVAEKDIATTPAKNVLMEDELPKDVLSIGTAAGVDAATATATATTNTAATATATTTTDTTGGDGDARQEVCDGGVEGGGGGGVDVSDDVDGAAGGAAPPPDGEKADYKGGDGQGSGKGSAGGSAGGSSVVCADGSGGGGGGGGGIDAASAGRDWGRGTLIAVSTAPRVWEDKSATSTLREHHPKIVAKTVSLIKAPTPLELRKQLDLLAENFGLMFGHPPPRDRARSRSHGRSRSRSRSRGRAGKLKSSSSTVLPSPSSSTSSLSSPSLPSSSPHSSPRVGETLGETLPCSRSRRGRVSGVGVGVRGFTEKGIGDSEEEDYAATTSSTATSSTGRSVDGESASPGNSDWDDPPCIMTGRAGGGGCSSGLGGAEGGKEGPTVAAVAAAAGGPW